MNIKSILNLFDRYYWVAILFVGLLTLLPIFNLALTGDDYLGLWRYNNFLSGDAGGHWNNVTFLLTDYGPQDSMTALIHHFFGFNHRIYYLISFLLRFIAAISFIPIIQLVTKYKRASYLAALFFMVTTIGLETTDWSFNMPSYIAIAFLNIFLFLYYKSLQKPSTLNSLLCGLLFVITIIAQPIRMTFLPLLVISMEALWLLLFKAKRNIQYSFLRIAICMTGVFMLFHFGHIGNSVGVGVDSGERSGSSLTRAINGYLEKPIVAFTSGKYETLLYPIAQIGAISVPTSSTPKKFEIVTLNQALIICIASIVLFFFFMKGFFIQKNKSQLSQSIPKLFLGLIFSWGILVWIVFFKTAQYPLSLSQLLSFLLGGYFILFSIHQLSILFQKKELFFMASIGIIILVISFALPWLRDPTFIQTSISRYLIVPATGLTLFVGILLGYSKQRKYFYYAFFIPLLVINIYSSHKYLSKLEQVRNIELADTIRKSIPHVNGFGTNEPVVFYFQPMDSDVLHHALLFGFPVIMGAQYDFKNVWNVVYTDRWNEVVSAYTDGETLKRFSIPQSVVKLENVYSYRLDGTQLKETTEETRQKLKETRAN